MIKIVVAVFGLASVAYVGLLIWFRMNEDTLLFHPEKGPLAPPPPELHLDYQDVAFPSTGGVALKARLISPRPAGAQAPPGWVLYFHGAAGNVGTAGYNEAWAKFRDVGLGVLAADYRGYGESEGQPSESGFYDDAAAAYVYLRETLHVAASHIVIYGYSLGTGVAIDLATHVQAAGLVVEGAFTSVPARAAELYPYVPVRSLARNRFASLDKIPHVTMPILFVHAREDEAVPLAHGKRLFDAATAPKRFVAVAGGHTTAFKVDGTFFEAIKHFVADLGLPVQ
ncbi:MAG: alpha/beta hydrolase [Deltaproteobacteria bacterium]|nr:alpha/beta hydrolase [Deltaproteobacteria bacterium]